MNGGSRTKPLPSRPSQDNGYLNGRGQTNGYTNGYTQGNDHNYNSSNGGSLPGVGGKVILEGYRQDILTGFEPEKPRYNPVGQIQGSRTPTTKDRSQMNTTRPQSSTLLNVKDEIQVHLLVETALGDSKEYEILSQEEVDDLKRQVQLLTTRIEQTRQNLAIQSKYRDAAINLSKLYASSGRGSVDNGDGKKRRSLLGHNRTPSHEVREADQERQASERRCEDLAAELWTLEKRLMVPQSRLLKHTAGILQMTHKGPATPKRQKSQQQSGIPGSPESMYTYHNSRSSIDFAGEEDIFDERSLYKSSDSFWDESSRDTFQQGPSKEQLQMIAATEEKLDNLNSRLRDILVKANPQRSLSPLPQRDVDTNPLQALQSNLEDMERNISIIDGEHEELVRGQNESQSALGNVEQTETIMMGLWDIIQSGEEEARQRKRERRQTRSAQNLPDDEDSPDEESTLGESYSLQAFSTKVQWLYTQATRLKDQKKVLQRQIKQQRELNSKSDASKDAELAQKTEELSRTAALLTRSEKDADSTREQLSLVMEKLDEARQQERLREQARSSDESSAVKQVQEELNQRIAITARLEEELQDLKDDQAISEAETKAKVSDAENKVADFAKKLAAAVAAKEVVESSVREKEQLLQTSDGKLQELQRGITQRDQQLQAKDQAMQAREQDFKARDQSSQQRNDELKATNEKYQKAAKELEDSNMEVARLQTEVTIARAELEGAYGSRAQRAAEATNKELEVLQLKNLELTGQIATLRERPPTSAGDDEKMKVLKKELEETIEEYEQMTKASIEWEKERESLEVQVDKLRDEREALEVQLSDEKVRWLGMKSPGIEGSTGGPGGNTSSTVLRNEFRKMMRDTRDGHSKLLRAEQEARRKAEDELRALKKQLGPGKSGLSQSFGSS